MNQYGVVEHFPINMFAGSLRRALAAWLVYAVALLAVFSAAHVHGLTDPDEPHSIAVLSLQAQAKTGIALPEQLAAPQAPAAVAMLLTPQAITVLPALQGLTTTRAPPGFP